MPELEVVVCLGVAAHGRRRVHLDEPRLEVVVNHDVVPVHPLAASFLHRIHAVPKVIVD